MYCDIVIAPSCQLFVYDMFIQFVLLYGLVFFFDLKKNYCFVFAAGVDSGNLLKGLSFFVETFLQWFFMKSKQKKFEDCSSTLQVSGDRKPLARQVRILPSG